MPQPKPDCPDCRGTGFVGDQGPGKNGEEYMECECVPRTSEAYFADRDRFVRYVREQVNPAREAEEHLFDVIQQRRYRR